MSDDVHALADVCSAWPALLPPNRWTVPQSAAKYLVIKRPGGTSGLWSPEETSYMVRPMEMLSSRSHSAVCFVGPSQAGKTLGLGEGWLTHAVINDPGDMAIIQMTQDKAREYSKQRIDRAIKNSPALRAMSTGSSRDDNLHDKQFKNGMWLRLAWPTASNLSSTSYRYVFGTDYDRWPANIDGEGDGFTLMGKRTTTFLSRGKVAVESSPGYPATDPLWVPESPHEAPPCGTPETGGGVLSIYNRSDRQRLYWKCPHCGQWFEAKPGLELFRLPSDDELLSDIRSLDLDRFARQHARIACPHCAAIIPFSQREGMNRAVLQGRGGWLADGLVADELDRISGTPRVSSIAGFWLGGVAAAYIKWPDLLQKHLQALLEYAMTGSEFELQTTANTDQCMPYMSRLLAEAKRAAGAGRRFDHGLARYVVPDEARFLVASVDVQGGKNARFEVEVHAVGEGKEQWLIDRYPIKWSNRDGFADDKAPIDPAAYPEDWDVLTEKVVLATYRTSDPDREMRVKRVNVDSGGEDGVTANAYAWYRRLRKQGLHRKVRLTKGASGKVDWHTKETMVGGEQGKGDIPLLLYCPNKFKDMVHSGLNRQSTGPGYYHFPVPRGPLNPEGWMPQSVIDELYAEVRNDNGVWVQIKPRNETLDLCVMVNVACMDLGADKRTFWDSPPAWALPHAMNCEIVTPEVRRIEKEAPPRVAVVERRVGRSSYLAG